MADEVVLLDQARRPVGTAPRRTVHGTATPLHLAFSCHLLVPDGRVLVTRRALGKRTWPGVWTNAFCGHPRPGEELLDAVARRGHDELGVQLSEARVVLTDFAYSATDDSGIVENEYCPVAVGILAEPLENLTPDPDEVISWRLVEPAVLVRVAALTPWLLSPWAALQLAEPALVAALRVSPAEPTGTAGGRP